MTTARSAAVLHRGAQIAYERAMRGQPASRGRHRSGTALVAAQARLRALADQCQKRNVLTNGPYYGTDAQREETIDAISSADRFDGVVTRNHYGCLVLNADHALFIDVDVPASDEIARHVGNGRPSSPWRRVLEDLRIVLANEREEGFRIYRTAAGFRILATAHEFEPGSPRSNRLMDAVGADEAFVGLCRIQNSFRARLTPKPWRCGVRRPPHSFPRKSHYQQRRFADWLEQYEQASRGWATCRYAAHVGPQIVHNRIAPVIQFHDRQTKALDALHLA